MITIKKGYVDYTKNAFRAENFYKKNKNKFVLNSTFYNYNVMSNTTITKKYNSNNKRSRITAAEELGKSLAKIMMSEKYNGFSFEDCRFILEVSALVATKTLEQESKLSSSSSSYNYNEDKDVEETRGEFQN